MIDFEKLIYRKSDDSYMILSMLNLFLIRGHLYAAMMERN